MDTSFPWALALIALVTTPVTFFALRDRKLFDRLLFRPEDILARHQYYRLLTSALVHVDWTHFLFNFIGIYSFGGLLEAVYGGWTFLGIYLVSVVGGSLLSLFLHRHEDYSAVGASGGVCGIIYATIFLVPGGSINFFFIPIDIPDYVYAVGFLVLSTIALRRGNSRVGHDAHIGGALVGLLAATVLYPTVVFGRPVLWLAVFSISVAIGVLLARGSGWLRLPTRGKTAAHRFFGEPEYRPSIRYQRYDEAAELRKEEEEMDRLLEQISAKGLKGLSRSERERLKELAAKRQSSLARSS